MQLPLVRCRSHKLNLHVEKMSQDDIALKNVIQNVHDAMMACRNGLKTSGMLRKLETLRPIVDNGTHGPGNTQCCLVSIEQGMAWYL